MDRSNEPLPETPVDAIHGIVRDRVILGDRCYWIDKPTCSDDLLRHPYASAAFAADEYLPYWADLWPASRMLAKAILAEPWPGPLQVLEVGCGLGLPGIAALDCGLHVTFSDYDRTAVQFALRNARINGFPNAQGRPFDWRSPPPGLQVDLLLASDLIYELRHIDPLIDLARTVVRPGGLILATDPDRPTAPEWRAALARLGWPVTRKVMRAGEPGRERTRGTLYRVTRPA